MGRMNVRARKSERGHGTRRSGKERFVIVRRRGGCFLAFSGWKQVDNPTAPTGRIISRDGVLHQEAEQHHDEKKRFFFSFFITHRSAATPPRYRAPRAHRLRKRAIESHTTFSTSVRPHSVNGPLTAPLPIQLATDDDRRTPKPKPTNSSCGCRSGEPMWCR